MHCNHIQIISVCLVLLTFASHCVNCIEPPIESKSVAESDKTNDNKFNNVKNGVESVKKSNAQLEHPAVDTKSKTDDEEKKQVVESNGSVDINKQNYQSIDTEIPSSIMIGFYVFVALGFVAVIYITYRSFR